MRTRKKVLVYPCGTEIGLEIYRSVSKSLHYEIWGGSSTYDHGRFVYARHIDGLPFLTDYSDKDEIVEFNKAISAYEFDYLYPAMDGVLTAMARYRNDLTPVLVAPELTVTEITRSKRKTYAALSGIIPVPAVYESYTEEMLPLFAKPDCGQGSVGTYKIETAEDMEQVKKDKREILVCEFLPGEEFTVDCFTNAEGKLIYAGGRKRRRTRNGISVNTSFEENRLFQEYAEKINSVLCQRGGWFFQVKYDKNGMLKLLEVASRIAGTSAITRNAGINLPLMTLHTFDGNVINDVLRNPGFESMELDRAFYNSFHYQIEYDTVYLDYDDTLIHAGHINTQLIAFLYQEIEKGKRIVLISRHLGNLNKELKERKLYEIFDEIIHLTNHEKKSDYITGNSIFIDDSYGERKTVYDSCHIPVFDPHMIECLLEERE